MQELDSAVEDSQRLRRPQLLTNDARVLAAHQRHVERGHHLVGDLVLDREHVLQEPGRDAHPLLLPAHCPFQDVSHAELASDVARLRGRRLVGEGGVLADQE